MLTTGAPAGCSIRWWWWVATFSAPWVLVADAQQPTPSVVDPAGWNPNDGTPPPEQKSWLEQHGRIAFVVVLGVAFLALVTWYIVRSVRGMRRRLQMENEQQERTIQQITDSRPQQPYPPPPSGPPPPSTAKTSSTPALQRY